MSLCTGAGRTDAGVHALGQVASFKVVNAIAPGDLFRALNAMLPEDVRVLSLDEAAPGFNARFHARSKVYRYRISNTRLMSPFQRRYAWHISRALDLEAMRLAARELAGEHDFASFQALGGTVKTSTRRITHSDWTEEPLAGGGRLLIYEIAGTGFLKYMVRAIVGHAGRSWRRKAVSCIARRPADVAKPRSGGPYGTTFRPVSRSR